MIFGCGKTNKTSSLPENAFLVDVRTSDEFSGGSVPGAINIPLTTVAASLDRFPSDVPVVVFCRSGNRSSKAQKILESNGYTNVTNGGGWKEVLSATQK